MTGGVGGPGGGDAPGGPRGRNGVGRNGSPNGAHGDADNDYDRNGGLSERAERNGGRGAAVANGGAIMLAGAAPKPERALPHNVQAEQAVLGAILVSNEVVDRVGPLESDHFYDPVHGRVFDVLKKRVAANLLCTPTTLKNALGSDPGLAELGGLDYLGRLAQSAVQIFHVRDYADQVYYTAMLRRLAEIGEEITVKALGSDDETSAAEQITMAEERLFQLAEKGQGRSGFKSFRHALVDAVEAANAAYQRDGQLSGLSTGLSDVDAKLGGLHNSDLLILAGRPSMGKTALVTNIAFNVASRYEQGTRPDGSVGAINGGVVGFFSLEMSAEQLANRILAEQAEVGSDKIRRGDMDEDEFRRFAMTARALEHAPLFIDDTPALRISELAARARRLKRQKGLDLLIVDYLQLCRGSSTKGSDNRVQEVSEITQGLKAIAKELNVPVIALSQLSRKVEDRDDKRPQLADLRESGSIEQDADVVMFVFREEYYTERTEPREGTPEHANWVERMSEVHNLAEVIVGKQRHGPIGTVKLWFDSRLTRFGDLARSDSRRST